MPVLTLPPPTQQVIVVTGRALPSPRSERLFPSETIGEHELRNGPQTGVERLLGRFAGVQLFRRSDARSGHPTSQGVTLRGLGGNAASRAQLILDGVPQSDPFGGWVAWPAFDSTDLAEMRLTRGGGTVIHGPGAIGGTIELTSSTDAGLLARAEVGDRSAFEGHISARDRVGAGLLTVSLQANRGSGFILVPDSQRGTADRPASYRNGAGRMRWISPLTQSTELQLNISAFGDRRERGLRYTANRSRGGDASVRIVSSGPLAWSLLAYGQRRNFRSSFASLDPQRSQARRTNLQFDVPGRSLGGSMELRPLLWPGVEFRAGVDGRWMRGVSNELASYSGGVAQRDRSSGGQSDYLGLFGEVSGTKGPFLASVGGRLDRWSIHDGRLLERLASTGIPVTNAEYPSRTGLEPTGRAAVAVAINRRISVRSAAYAAWRLPTLNELFRPFRVGSDATAANASLRPERLRGAEAGADWKSGPFAVSVTAFVNLLRNPIVNVTLGSGPATFPGVGFVAGAYRQRQNIRAVRTQGLEVAGSWRSGPWRASFGSSLASARMRASSASSPLDGLRPAQTPRFSSSATLSWQQLRRSFTATAHYESARFEDDLNRQKLPSALTFDAAAAWPVTRDWSLVTRLENAFDAEISAGVSSEGIIERATPRTLWIGVRFLQR